MPLKFLRLPQLILTEVIDNLMPEEIFLLSLCSQKLLKVLQLNFRKSAKLKITVNVSTTLYARYNLNGQSGRLMKFAEHSTQRCRTSLQHVKIGGKIVPISRHRFQSRCTFNLMDSKLVINHILRLFRKNVHHVQLYGEPLRKNVNLYGEPQERTKETEDDSFGGGSLNGDDDWFSIAQQRFFNRNIDSSPPSKKTFSIGALSPNQAYSGNSSKRYDPINDDFLDKDMGHSYLVDNQVNNPLLYDTLDSSRKTSLHGKTQERTEETADYSFGGGSFNALDDWFRPDPISYDLSHAEMDSILFADELSPPQAPNKLQIDLDISKMISWDTVDHLDANVVIPTDALKGVQKTIWLKDSSCVALDDLMNMNQVEIYLEKSKLTSADIKVFLSSWMNGGSFRLRFFSCQMTEEVDKQKIYEGLKVEKTEMKEYKSLRDGDSLRLPTGTRREFLPDFEFQRSDGGTVAGKCGDKKVTLLFYPPKFELEQRPTT